MGGYDGAKDYEVFRCVGVAATLYISDTVLLSQ